MRLAAIGIVFLLCACNQEQSFDERYQAAEKQIREKAKDIDTDIGKRGQKAVTPMPTSMPTLTPAAPPMPPSGR